MLYSKDSCEMILNIHRRIDTNIRVHWHEILDTKKQQRRCTMLVAPESGAMPPHPFSLALARAVIQNFVWSRSLGGEEKWSVSTTEESLGMRKRNRKAYDFTLSG
ncbi:hypothetical protein CEXT_88311 [Caerostris extrusa]|uniref:Uncharacterized protein n=1 Tax=Caerostris extrusa TaxID=172846 RepID=A0AAV4UFY4_CAEEX|nr:hypothetical protein CEXT_88311 [Caerostris extrusa]